MKGAASLSVRPWEHLRDPQSFASVYRRFLAAYTPPSAAALVAALEAGAGGAGADGDSAAGESAAAGADIASAAAEAGAGVTGAGVAELEWKIFKNWTARLEERFTLVHAAVLGRRGRVVVLAGRTGKGKTTLALALLARGWTFLSDDCAVLEIEEAAGRVTAWPAPGALHVKGHLSRLLADSLPRLLAAVPYPPRFFAGAGGTAACCLVRPRALAPPGRPWPVAAIVLLERRGDESGSAAGPVAAGAAGEAVARDPVLERLTPAAGLTELVFHSFARTPERLGRDFRLLAQLVRDAPCHRLTPGDPGVTAALVEELASRRSTRGRGPGQTDMLGGRV